MARHYDKAMDYGWRAGERAMARYAPAAAADAYRRAAQAARLSSGVSPSERSFYLEALGDAEFLAGRSTEAAAAYLEALRGVRGQPLREAHLALKLTRVEQRRGHYSNALRRASLGLRAVRRRDRSGGGRRSCPAASPLRVLPGQPGSLRGCPPMGGARPRRSRGGP